MTKDHLSGRERWQAVLEGETPDRVPMDIWATREACDRLLAYLECDFDTMLRRLHIDQPVMLEARYAGPELTPGTDMWGLRRSETAYGTGAYDEVVNHPLAKFDSPEAICANYTWPTADWWDFGDLPKIAAENEGRVIRGGFSEPFLLYKDLRGDEQAYLDLIMYPDIVKYCVGKIVEYDYEMTRRTFESAPGTVLVTFIAEDLGGQDALMYSPEHICTYLLPHMKRMIELTRQNGSYAFFHTDGAVRDILPTLIDAGVQALNPIQWRCTGMDREGLKRDFGDKLVFHGGVDNQITLPFGSVDDVRQEVADNLEILGAGGGYILAPCHNIQSITPPENIVAMYDAGYEYGRR